VAIDPTAKINHQRKKLMMNSRPRIYLKLLTLFTFLFICIDSAYAEYRAYLIEVYDHISQKKWDAVTGFSPDKYILTHGGGNRLSVFTKATWVCYGDTSTFDPACPMPGPIKPIFKVGDRVKINLEKHITQGWLGVVELAYYQKGVRSNVYGVRFGDKRRLYNRYFEFNLEKAVAKQAVPETSQTEQETAAAPANATAE